MIPISTLFGAIKTVDSLLSTNLSEKIPEKSARFLAELYNKDNSITAILKPLIVEPTIIINNTLKSDPVTEKVIITNVNIFASYYIQAFEILHNLRGLETGMAVDLLSSKMNMQIGNENRSNKIEITNLSLEDLNMLPIKKETVDHISLEAERSANIKRDKENFIPQIYSKDIEIEITSTTYKDVDGKQTKITNSIKIPIIIKAHIIFTNKSNILNMLDVGKDTGFFERLDEYRSGGITLSDFIFGSDLIEKYKNNKIKDEDSLLEFMRDRELSSTSQIAKHNLKGFSAYYSTVIIDKDDVDDINTFLNGKLRKYNNREEFFIKTKSMLLSIMDRDYEMVSFYTKDIKGTSEVSFKSLSKSKDSGTDIKDIVSLLMANKSPL